MLFTDTKERAKAFAVYGAIAGGGSAVGLLLGGVLTEYADWRWCFWVNLPVAIFAIVAAIPIVPESKAPGDTSYDVPGAVLITLGLASFVYGFTRVGMQAQENAAAGVSDNAWAEPWALFFIVAGALLVVAFVVLELKTRNPLLPMRIVLDRNRGGAYLTSTLVGAGLLGAFFFLSLYFQQVLAYTPVEAGFASLPTTLGVLISAGAGQRPGAEGGPEAADGRSVACSPPAGCSCCRSSTSTAGSGSSPFPGQLLLGLGLGFTFVPLSNLALIGAGEHDAGAASAMLNATQQVGASIGTALLATLSVGRDHRLLHRRGRRPAATPRTRRSGLQAQVEGYTTAFTWASVLLVLGALVSAVLIKATKDDLPAEAVVHAGCASVDDQVT